MRGLLSRAPLGGARTHPRVTFTRNLCSPLLFSLSSTFFEKRLLVVGHSHSQRIEHLSQLHSGVFRFSERRLLVSLSNFLLYDVFVRKSSARPHATLRRTAPTRHPAARRATLRRAAQRLPSNCSGSASHPPRPPSDPFALYHVRRTHRSPRHLLWILMVRPCQPFPEGDD